jgi:lysyl-tRNA synthetase class II
MQKTVGSDLVADLLKEGMMLLGQESIRDVILFPQLKPK